MGPGLHRRKDDRTCEMDNHGSIGLNHTTLLTKTYLGPGVGPGLGPGVGPGL